MGMPKSFNILFSQTTWYAVSATPLYSASMLDSAIVGCFLLLHDIPPLSREKLNPDVDSFVAGPIDISVPVELNWCDRFVEDVVIHGSTHIP